MKIFLVGNGGRENALAWAITCSPSFKDTGSQLFSTSGNPGIDRYASPVSIKPDDIPSILSFVEKEKIDFTVVGPEIALSMGIADALNENGYLVFGPSQTAAEIESSKIFAKGLMKKYNIPTAAYEIFDENNIGSFSSFVEKSSFPLVIKADGLAAGKGVIIAQDKEEALRTAKEFIEDSVFGSSGRSFVAEEFMQGEEASVFVITDGDDYVILPPSQDHKRIGDGDKGKNTGGMGAYAPADTLVSSELMHKIEEKIVKPVLGAMRSEGRKFKGCLYCGIMVTPEGEPKVVEFNCRFGDPETQAVLPLITSDFLEMLLASANGSIKDYKLETSNEYACCVVLASKGYPDTFEKGKVIKGIDKTNEGYFLFHSGTAYSGSDVITNGGRVLSVVCKGKDLTEAIGNTYKNVDIIEFENKYYRKDIGYKALNKNLQTEVK